MSWLITSLRRLRDARVASVGLALFVLVTAFLFGVAPRALAAAADSVLHDQLAAAKPSVRGISLVRESRIEPSGDAEAPMSSVYAAGTEMEAQFPPLIGTLVTGPTLVTDTFRWTVKQPRIQERTLRIRFQPGAAERVRVTSGRLPEPVPPGAAFEIALSTESSRVLGLGAGQLARLDSDGSDRLASRQAAELNARIVGVFEVADPADPFWADDQSLVKPTTRQVGPFTQVDDITSLAADTAYADFESRLPTEVDLRFTWRYDVDPNALDAATAQPLLDALGRMQAIFPSAIASGGTLPTAGLAGNLRGLVQTFVEAWLSIQTVFLIIGIGVGAVAFAAMGLVTVLASARRRTIVALWRGRGASEGQIIRSSLAEAVVLIVPPALVALVLAILVVPGQALLPSIAICAGVALAGTVLLAAAVPNAPPGPPRGASRDVRVLLRTQPRRLVAEALVVLVAVVGAFLLRERGVRGTSSTGELTTADPLIAAVPALAGIALGLVVMRLFPLPMRLFAQLSGMRRDLVPVLALRRLTRSPLSGAVLVVLLSTGAVWAFASAALVHVERAAEVVGWQEVGADYRITARSEPLPRAFDALGVAGVQAAARAYRGAASLPVRGLTVSLIALDVADYQRVVAGTPADPGLPPQILGDVKSLLPAIVSSELAESSRGIALGDTFEVTISGARVPLTAVETRARFPGIEATDPFVIISRDQLLELRDDLTALNTSRLLFVRAPSSADAALTLAVSGNVAGASLERRAQRSSAIQTSPVVNIVREGALVSVAIAAVFAVLAVAAGLALTGAARANEVAHLRAVGLTRRQAFGLIVVEHVPTVAVAFAAGLALGLGLFIGLRPSLGLAAVVGSAIEVPVEIGGGQVLLVLAAISLIVAIGVGLAAAVQRRVVPSLALRRGSD
jgi:putative ABC transport system permease protein